MLATQAIQQFLAENNCLLLDKYNPYMHVGVGVERTITKPSIVRGLRHYEEGDNKWYEIEIPLMRDHELTFDYEKYFYGISMSGWNHVEKTSDWVSIDLDAKSTSLEVDLEPNLIIENMKSWLSPLEGVRAFTSSSGRGLHLYVNVQPQKVNSLLAHRILRDTVAKKISSIVGPEFNQVFDDSRIDVWICNKHSKHLQPVFNNPGIFSLD